MDQVLFNVLFSLGGTFDVVQVVVNPCLGVVIMLLAMYAAMKFWPKFINGTLVPKQVGKMEVHPRKWKFFREPKNWWFADVSPFTKGCF